MGSLTSCFTPSKEVAKVKDAYGKYLGKKYILDKDTLTIINYSIWKETFILSNGREIDYHLVIDTTSK